VHYLVKYIRIRIKEQIVDGKRNHHVFAINLTALQKSERVFFAEEHKIY